MASMVLRPVRRGARLRAWTTKQGYVTKQRAAQENDSGSDEEYAASLREWYEEP
jgi:hypothetical protein